MRYSQLRFRAGNLSVNDIERAVLPTIMWANAISFTENDVPIHGYGLTIGWWKWGIGVTYTWANADGLSSEHRTSQKASTTDV